MIQNHAFLCPTIHLEVIIEPLPHRCAPKERTQFPMAKKA